MISRESLGWPGTGKLNDAPTNKGLVIHYDGGNRKLTEKEHSECLKYWQWCRKFHTQERGWADIGYSYGVCPHGVIFEGRGFGKEQAAQPGGNRVWCSVTLMLGPGEKPSVAQVQGVLELRSDLMQKHGMKGAVSWHGKFYKTDCPGDIIRGMIIRGEFSKEPSVANADKFSSVAKEMPVITDLSPEAHSMVRSIQRVLGVKDDGDIGPITWANIFKKLIK